jgi:C1A family cysteine protease
MRFKILFPIILFALCLVGCSVFVKETPKQKSQPIVKFMEKDQIFAELNAMSKTKYLQKDDQLTDADKERLKKLIDLNNFFPKGVIKKLEKQKKLKFQSANKNAKEYAPQMQVDMRYRDTPIKSQDDGKCTAFAGAAAMENTLQKDKLIPNLNLSEWDVWSKYGVYSCDSFMTNLTKSVNKVCEERYYPQYGKKSTDCTKTASAYITDSQYLGNDISEITRSLNEGHVVYIGMSTPNDIVKCKNIVNPKNGFANGGHALLLVGYYTDPSLPNETVAIVRNSWGTDCADRGYHYMPLSIIKKSGANFGSWEIKGATSSLVPSVDPTPVVTPVPTPDPVDPVDPNCTKWKRIWWKPWVWKCIAWE